MPFGVCSDVELVVLAPLALRRSPHRFLHHADPLFLSYRGNCGIDLGETRLCVGAGVCSLSNVKISAEFVRKLTKLRQEQRAYRGLSDIVMV